MLLPPLQLDIIEMEGVNVEIQEPLRYRTSPQLFTCQQQLPVSITWTRNRSKTDGQSPIHHLPETLTSKKGYETQCHLPVPHTSPRTYRASHPSEPSRGRGAECAPRDSENPLVHGLGPAGGSPHTLPALSPGGSSVGWGPGR